MPEYLLQKLEEKMMTIISEVEELRKANQRLQQENSSLRMEGDHHGRKLQELIALLDAASATETISMPMEPRLSAIKPALMQGSEVFDQ